jgi:F-type H+-transporting ATPase subunit b
VLIDWFTVIAQMINFLILAALLKRFLYGPIIKAMDEREERIRSRLREAETREEESRKEAERYRVKTEEMDDKRKEVLSAAEKEAEERKKDLIRMAKDEANQLQVQWRDSILRERETFLGELKKLAGRGVYSTTRRVLQDLADADLQERITEVFLRRVKSSDLKDAMPEGDHGFEIRSAFDVPVPMRKKIARVIQDHAGRKMEIRFVRREEMSPGIELRAPGRKIAWTLSSYLEGIEEDAQKVLEEEASGSEGTG